MAQSMNESRIVYLYEAVRCGSIRAAADWLDVAPSAVSRQIGLLEKELAVPLIERHARGVTPTAAGQQLIDYFREQAAHRDDLLSRLDALRGLRRGHIDIVLGEGFVADVLAGPLRLFRSQHPAITVTLDLAGTNEVVRRVAEDEAEIGLVYSPPPDPRIVSRLVCTQPLQAVVGPAFALRGKQSALTPRELARFPMALTHPAYGTRQIVEAVAFAERIRFEPAVTTNSIAIVKQFVRSELGVTCLPAFAVSDELDAGTLFALELDHPLFRQAQAHLVTRVGRRLSVAANRMLQMMGAQMRAFR
ncbi:LysR family transcriptional regulator [Chitinasiproducens palmae]|uniref:DNA-binding transcriptional regulator, LysR family n=1 Tax=Chitinasiproducens palmae TaxID=1770053 RepID=A0A1H2PMY2_9BURK|nr:LysR family transcriptional regulator [Chitinasiproducens palmae]SDV47964.1 DNA-binding transcriptional regulator, LysR family [Chitinasiproducens palmae]